MKSMDQFEQAEPKDTRARESTRPTVAINPLQGDVGSDVLVPSGRRRTCQSLTPVGKRRSTLPEPELTPLGVCHSPFPDGTNAK